MTLFFRGGSLAAGGAVDDGRAASVKRWEIFLYFCMRCLALISLPNAACPVYVVFLHEANVAVDFLSFFFVITV